MTSVSLLPRPMNVNHNNFVPARSGAEIYRAGQPITDCVTDRQASEYVSEANWDAYYALATGKPTQMTKVDAVRTVR